MLTNPGSSGVSIGDARMASGRSSPTRSFGSSRSRTDTFVVAHGVAEQPRRAPTRAWTAASPRDSRSASSRRPTSRHSASRRSLGHTFDATREPRRGLRAGCGPQLRVLAAALRRTTRRARPGHRLSRRHRLGDWRDALQSSSARPWASAPTSGCRWRCRQPSLPGRDWLRDAPGQRREGDVAARVRPTHARRATRARAGERERRLSAGADDVLRVAWPTQAMRKRFLDQRLTLQSAATGASSLRSDFAEPL